MASDILGMGKKIRRVRVRGCKIFAGREPWRLLISANDAVTSRAMQFRLPPIKLNHVLQKTERDLCTNTAGLVNVWPELKVRGARPHWALGVVATGTTYKINE